jgi:molecular chaperone HscB
MRKGVAVVENRSMYKDDQNPFEVLGIEVMFDVNLAALDEAYFVRQSLAHPDRFVYHSEPERQAASTQSSVLNRAYETLKNPTLRAKALLKLRGIEVGGEDGKSVHDAQILEEMMDLQEAVINAISPQEVSLVTDQIQDRLKQVVTAFGEALQKDKVQELPGLFLRLTYLSKLMGDIKIHQQQSSLKVL